MEISRQFVTMESKYAFAIYLNTQYLGPNTWAGLARFAVLPRSRHPEFNFQTRSQGWQGCSTLWLHDNRDGRANWQRDPTRIMESGPYSNKLSKNMALCKLMRFLLLIIFTFMRSLGAAVKEGIPSDYDLELLSVKVEKWKKLGRRLKLEDAELTALHQENEELSEKAFAMLKKWRQKNASDATYRCLYDALCHVLVNRKDLAEKFCCSCSKLEG